MRKLLILALLLAGCTVKPPPIPYIPRHAPQTADVTWTLGDTSTCRFDGTIIIEAGWLAHSDDTLAWVEWHEYGHCLTWAHGLPLQDGRPWLTRVEVTANCVARLHTSEGTFAQLPDVLRSYYPCSDSDMAVVARWLP